jgi:hypothetical protein
MVAATKTMVDERLRPMRQELIILQTGTIFLPAGYEVHANGAVRKGKASVRNCLSLAEGLFGNRIVLYTSK